MLHAYKTAIKSPGVYTQISHSSKLVLSCLQPERTGIEPCPVTSFLLKREVAWRIGSSAVVKTLGWYWGKETHKSLYATIVLGLEILICYSLLKCNIYKLDNFRFTRFTQKHHEFVRFVKMLLIVWLNGWLFKLLRSLKHNRRRVSNVSASLATKAQLQHVEDTELWRKEVIFLFWCLSQSFREQFSHYLCKHCHWGKENNYFEVLLGIFDKYLHNLFNLVESTGNISLL